MVGVQPTIILTPLAFIKSSVSQISLFLKVFCCIAIYFISFGSGIPIPTRISKSVCQYSHGESAYGVYHNINVCIVLIMNN